jgi:hypothetical protein
MDFSERLRRRHQLWWETGIRWGDPRTYRAAIHARQELRQRRSSEDSAETWRCCPQWPRRLLNKWNAREFAVHHGAPVPELYRYGRSARELPLESLPNRYVIRPVVGAHARGVMVMVDGHELLLDEARPAETLRADLVGPYLVEQFIGREGDGSRLPVEYKCHTFGGRVAAVQVLERVSCRPRQTTRRYYRPDWGAFDDPMDLADPLADPIPPPAFLEQMVEVSARMGAAIGTYMRIDFLAGEAGVVFNEFSSTPGIRKPQFTPWCNELFGRIWEEACPGAT